MSYLVRAIFLQLFLVALSRYVFVSCGGNVVKARKYVFVKAFQGEPKRSDFRIVEEVLPPVKDGEFLAEALYISVDPYMRAFSQIIPIGGDMIGGQVAKIVESKNKDYPVGALVYGHFGWRTRTVVNLPEREKDMFPTFVLPDLGDLSPSLGLGVLGMPGNTAYFGFLGECKPQKGQTVVVTSAAGTVGSIVGQMARIVDTNVIGFAGSPKKLNWLKQIGFSHGFNYKTADIDEVLNLAAPNGVDCFFDNVGGELGDKITAHMNHGGRVVKCGSISTYNLDPSQVPKSSINETFIKSKDLTIEQFLVMGYRKRWLEGIAQNLKWVKEGKIQYKEDVIVGFDKVFDAFIGLFRGTFTGKPVVKV